MTYHQIWQWLVEGLHEDRISQMEDPEARERAWRFVDILESEARDRCIRSAERFSELWLLTEQYVRPDRKAFEEQIRQDRDAVMLLLLWENWVKGRTASLHQIALRDLEPEAA